MERNIVFSSESEPGLEHVRLVEQNGEIIVDSLLIAVEENMPFRARYTIRCDSAWHVREATFELLDHQSSKLHLQTNGKGHWNTASGEALPALDGCIDIDITVTPFTNTLPIRRLNLVPGASAEITVVYIQVPELQFRPAKQRYTYLSTNASGSIYKYEGLESDFTAELQADKDGLILNYPNLWKRVWPAREDMKGK